MFNLSETAKISCYYESFTITGAIFRETDRTNLYSQYYIAYEISYHLIISLKLYFWSISFLKYEKFLYFVKIMLDVISQVGVKRR